MLLQAAIELIRQGGIGAVSTVSVTQAAGFTQSSFYRHFRNVDECLVAAAEKVSGEARAFIAEHRRRTHEQAASDVEAHVAHFRAVLGLFLEERQFTELLLRYRYDISPLGEVMRQHMAQIRADMLTDVWAAAQWLGIGDEHYASVTLQAEFILASVMAAGEGLLEGRFTDTDLVAHELTAAGEAIVQHLLTRLTKTMTP